MRRLFLNRLGAGQKEWPIPKNRCRTTIAERVMETLKELCPGSGRLLKPRTRPPAAEPQREGRPAATTKLRCGLVFEATSWAGDRQGGRKSAALPRFRLGSSDSAWVPPKARAVSVLIITQGRSHGHPGRRAVDAAADHRGPSPERRRPLHKAKRLLYAATRRNRDKPESQCFGCAGRG